MALFCSACGKIVNVKYCRHCGQELDKDTINLLLIKLSYSTCFPMKIEVIVEMSWMKLIKDFRTFCKYPAMFLFRRAPHRRKKEHPRLTLKLNFFKLEPPYLF